MKSWKNRLMRLLLPEIYFRCGRKYQHFLYITLNWKSLSVFFLEPLLGVWLFGPHLVILWNGWMSTVAAFNLSGYDRNQLSVLMTLPVSPRDFTLGRLLWSVCCGLLSTILYIAGVYFLQHLRISDWGFSELLRFSQVLALGLIQFSVCVLFHGVSVLFVGAPSPKALVLLSPLTALVFGAYTLVRLNLGDLRIFPETGVPLFVALLSLPAALRLALVCCRALANTYISRSNGSDIKTERV